MSALAYSNDGVVWCGVYGISTHSLIREIIKDLFEIPTILHGVCEGEKMIILKAISMH